MKLQVKPRAANRKSEVNQLRREGNIPAVLYIKGNSGENILINGSELSTHLRHIKSGHLPTTIFTLMDESGSERRAIIKDIQYQITNYEVMHLDFEELVDDQKVSVKVPVECTGVVECVGIKLGGVLRQTRHVKVRCFPKDIPDCFQVDIKELGLRQSKRLSDLNIPEKVQPLMKSNEVIAIIVKR
jgi:large subunit ribosomal protein L25